MKRKIPSFALLMAVCLSLAVPALANAGDYVITDGILTAYQGGGGEAVVPEGVTLIEKGAFDQCTEEICLTIPGSVKLITWSNFRNNRSLTSVILCDGVEEIDVNAFNNCVNLISVAIPASVTAIADGAFADCPNLTIYGTPGSAAEAAAKASGRPFEDVGALGAPAEPNLAAPPADTIPASVTAKASTQTVTVDGKKVEFQMYALLDEKGNGTNYIKLRDMAQVLNGTKAQFSVGYDSAGKSISVTTGEAYASTGTEMTTPFSGDRAYTGGTQSVQVNGKAVELTAITLMDDAGGGYHYFKLRDLGKALDFNAGYSKDQGVFIESGKPYAG